MNGEVKTKPELEKFLEEFRDLHNDPNTNGFTLLMCDNSQAVVQTFLESEDGLGIGAFAEIAGVSVDTVRHWVESGVISVYSLNSKFKFFPTHLLELRSVQQWQGLGLTLEQIKERKAAGMAFVPPHSFKIGDEVLDGGLVQMFSNDDPRVQDLQPKAGELFKKGTDFPASKNAIGSVKADFDAQIEKLEQQQRELEQRITNAKALRARLEINH
jgi:DNA-binding transcriptional MerR regulator